MPRIVPSQVGAAKRIDANERHRCGAAFDIAVLN